MVDTRIFETEDTNSGVYFVYFVHEAIFTEKQQISRSFSQLSENNFLVSRITTSVLFMVHGF